MSAFERKKTDERIDVRPHVFLSLEFVQLSGKPARALIIELVVLNVEILKFLLNLEQLRACPSGHRLGGSVAELVECFSRRILLDTIVVSGGERYAKRYLV